MKNIISAVILSALLFVLPLKVFAFSAGGGFGGGGGGGSPPFNGGTITNSLTIAGSSFSSPFGAYPWVLNDQDPTLGTGGLMFFNWNSGSNYNGGFKLAASSYATDTDAWQVAVDSNGNGMPLFVTAANEPGGFVCFARGPDADTCEFFGGLLDDNGSGGTTGNVPINTGTLGQWNWGALTFSNTVSATPQNSVGCVDTSVTVTGATTAMGCDAAVAGALPAADANSTWSCYVSAANTVKLHLCTVVALTGSSASFNIRVIK